MFAIRVGVGGASLSGWWHSLVASPSEEVNEFEADSNQLIMDVELKEICSERSPRRHPIQFKNNSTSVLAVALIVIAIVMFAFIL
ncbi:hypothetical protein Y032_0126g1363 [Ancylostoma ceylanicum]|uniref:Uncharacterized protein n=1 Tax=Ancylostoma ceylanicum TaxID=53326 RepID=A0A016T8R0_9BILA|nr:hypothetical protein Y032_0126g1363 [Ancylostoma ceylanicum]